MICEKCEGSGLLNQHNVCSDCNGIGKIGVDSPIEEVPVEIVKPKRKSLISKFKSKK